MDFQEPSYFDEAHFVEPVHKGLTLERRGNRLQVEILALRHRIGVLRSSVKKRPNLILAEPVLLLVVPFGARGTSKSSAARSLCASFCPKPFSSSRALRRICLGISRAR